MVRLGSGGFGHVWMARDESLRVDVAVKEIRLPASSSDTEQDALLARAVREARNAARLRDHPHVVAVHDIVMEGDVPWMVMQLVDGCSLQDHLTRHEPLSVDRAAEVAVALLRALEAAHAIGIVHRDVKPANVMLARSGEVLLADFGIAVHSADTRLTGTGMFVGSPGYAAPERVRGADGGGASDLFSLGVTLYQAVEWHTPFRLDDPAAVVLDEAPPPQQAGRLTALITQLLEKNPDRRLTIPQALAMVATPTSTLPPAAAGDYVVVVPPLGKRVTECTVTRWLKRVGERVKQGEPLVELSTDKVDTELPSPATGTLKLLLVAEDETVAIGVPLATIDTTQTRR
ncbi:protein kinase domain-containing protein [Streptomyces sp. SAJ15]|uniref:protein kinase domain-containing protein n=1 Tax=Streptomyces sp. SAJ15 TaxID=2011095 RepID=UPI0021B48948|nr:protein kinase [Streptomyces sp. SAJ15]